MKREERRKTREEKREEKRGEEMIRMSVGCSDELKDSYKIRQIFSIIAVVEVEGV